MRKSCLFAVAILLLVAGVLPGCGGESTGGEEEKLAVYTVENILLSEEGESDFLVEWRRKSTGPGDVSPRELAQRFWKCEGGVLAEIGAEEYYRLAGEREDGNPDLWTYSQHAVTVLELDMEKGEAVVETGSFYGPLSGEGVRYVLRKENDEWRMASEQTVWAS